MEQYHNPTPQEQFIRDYDYSLEIISQHSRQNLQRCHHRLTTLILENHDNAGSYVEGTSLYIALLNILDSAIRNKQ